MKLNKTSNFLKIIFCLLTLSCESLKPESQNLKTERNNLLLSKSKELKNCLSTKNNSSYQFRFKIIREKFSIINGDAYFKMTIEDQNNFGVKSSQIISDSEIKCLKNVISTIKFQVRDSRMSSEELEIEVNI